MPFFSVIIPTYNRAALLREAMESVLSQTFTDYEIIVVDDGSTDETATVVAGFRGPIRYLRQENKGPGAARNLGIENAQGEYIAFLDSDDLWFSWTLKTYQQAIFSIKRPAFIAGKEVRIKALVDFALIRPKCPIFTNYSDYLASSRESIWIGTCSVAIETSTLRAVGAFGHEHINAEDSDLWLRLGEAPGFVVIESPPVFGHRLTPGSEVTNQGRNFRGLLALMEAEANGHYPGGNQRRLDRWRIVARHTRPGSINLLRKRAFSDALAIYFRSFFIQFALGKFKYLCGFWLVLLKHITTDLSD